MPLLLTRALVPYELAAKWEADGRPGFADPYAVHQRVWDCFPGRPRADRDFLTRADPQQEDLRILLLSAVEPARPPWCPDAGWQSKTIEEDGFFSHARYRFSLLANPTRKVRSNAAGEVLRNSRRVPITHREDRHDADGRRQRGLVSWLVEHGEAAGFTVDPDTLRTITRPRQPFVQPPKNGSPRRTGILHGVDFQGVLTVTDRDKLRAAFATGIGPAKAFGFGMLCLAPLE